MKVNIKQEQQKNIWITTTGYRIFLVFKSLIESPKTIDELVDIVTSDYHLNNVVSKDTIRFDINTLKNSGCNISRPNKGNNFKYELIYHPFNLSMSKKEISILIELRNILAADVSLPEVLVLNSLYEKIFSLNLNKDTLETALNTEPLSGINKKLIKEFLNPSIIGKKVQIQYKSPKFGIENTDIIPKKILYEDKKAYVQGFNFKYNKVSLFEFSRIMRINSISTETYNIPVQSFNVVYEIKGDALNKFKLKSYEKILEKTNEVITISADVEDDFMFIQRLFLFGSDFRIIQPKSFKEKLINKIKLVQKGYSDDKA